MPENTNVTYVPEEKHSFFRGVLFLNFAADIYMAMYSGIVSGQPAVLVGMSVLSVCFLLGIGGIVLLRMNVKRSSAAAAGLSLTLVNLLIGFIFACEHFGLIRREILPAAELAASAAIIILVVISVNILVRRRIEKRF